MSNLLWRIPTMTPAGVFSNKSHTFCMYYFRFVIDWHRLHLNLFLVLLIGKS